MPFGAAFLSNSGRSFSALRVSHLTAITTEIQHLLESPRFVVPLPLKASDKNDPFCRGLERDKTMMNGTMKTIFGSLAAGALALTPMAAATAEETATPANQNVTSAAASVEQLQVQYIGVQDQTINDARIVAANASHNKVAIVVWGGNRTIQQEAYNAALDLVDMGIPTAFVLAPDHNTSDEEAVMQVYAASTPRTDAAFGTNYAGIVRQNMREAGIIAYREAFPRELAALSIR